MTTLYAEAARLKLEAGNEVEAFVRAAPGASTRPKCLLLHGNPGSILDWQPMIARLAGTADLAAIDLPGFGKSPRIDASAESMSLDRLAEQALFAASALGWREPFFLIGHSHGGGVAQAAAARYPDRIAGLVLIATLGAPAHASYRLLSLPGAGSSMRLLARVFRSQRVRGLKRAILQRVLKDLFKPERVSARELEQQLDAFSARPELLVSMAQVTRGRPCSQLLRSAADIRCPTLFLHGSHDAVVPARYAQAIHDRILNAGGRSRFELIPDAGHLLIEQRAAELASLIVSRMLEPRHG